MTSLSIIVALIDKFLALSILACFVLDFRGPPSCLFLIGDNTFSMDICNSTSQVPESGRLAIPNHMFAITLSCIVYEAVFLIRNFSYTTAKL